jgi:DNA polymerase-1
MDNIVTTAREKGYVETMWGRRRPLRDITSANATLRSAAERVAINAPIQGTAADMIKLAMIRVSEKLRTGTHQARLLLQVHDELVLEAPPEEVEAVTTLVRREMTHALPLPGVPVVVECGVGDHWLEAH